MVPAQHVVSFPNDCSSDPAVNFNLPLPPTLETARVQLTPFISSIHGSAFYAGCESAPQLGRYLPWAFSSYASFLSFFEKFILSDRTNVLFAIIDKTKDSNGDIKMRLAGIIGIFRCSPSNRTVEITPLVILPAFQDSFVAFNALGALFRYFLDSPSNGGMGFRRVAWTTHPSNKASIRGALRMGAKMEGISRWTYYLSKGGEGKEAAKDRGSALGRDSVLFAICWDDWENGVKRHFENLGGRDLSRL